MLLSISSTSHALFGATCPINYSPKPSLQPSFNEAERKIKRALSSLKSTTSSNLDKQSDVVVASINVLTAQKALSATQIGKAVEDNNHTQAQAEHAKRTQERIRQVEEDYGSRSQGHNVCGVLVQRNDTEKMRNNTKDAVAFMVQNEVSARPGRYAPRREAMAERLALHDSLYCTAAQVNSGLCQKVGARAGKSLVASTLFEPAPYDSVEYRDKSAFINNMMGLPNDPLSQETASTQNGIIYADLKRRKDSINSTALTSLKSIQAHFSGVPSNHQHEHEGLAVAKTEAQQLAQAGQISNGQNRAASMHYSHGGGDGSGVPLALQLKNDVERYLGNSDEHKAWSKTLVEQTEKGVLREVLQVKALRLYLQAQQYEQLSRIEGMLAANVAAETYRNGMEGNIEQQRNAIMRATTARQISLGD